MYEEMELQVCQMWFNIVVAAAPGGRDYRGDGRQTAWHLTPRSRRTTYTAEQSCMDPCEGGMDLLINTHINLPTVCMCWCTCEWEKCAVCVCLFMDVKSFSVWQAVLMNAWFLCGFMGVMVSDSRTSFTPGINICLIWSQVDCTKHKCKWGTKWKHIGSLKPFLEVVGITCGHIYLQCKC